jgi:hypothetical protein
VVVTIAAVCVYAIRQADPDLYGYLAYGRLVPSTGARLSGSIRLHLRWIALGGLRVSRANFSMGLLPRFRPHGLIGLKCIVGGLAIRVPLACAADLDRQPRRPGADLFCSRRRR